MCTAAGRASLFGNVSVDLAVSLSGSLSVGPSVVSRFSAGDLSVCLSSVSLSVSICPSVCESEGLSVGLFGSLPVCESIELPIHFPDGLSVGLPVLSTRLAVGL